VFANIFDPLVHALSDVLTGIHMVVPSYGWSLVVLGLVVRLAVWPFTVMQFRSTAEMQKVQPLVAKLRNQYKGDPQGLNKATMELYKEHNVNPLAGCIPALIPLPILIGLYWAIQSQIAHFHETFLWIGMPVLDRFTMMLGGWHVPLAAPSLASPDFILLALYVVSMYFTVRYGSPPSQDPQQAQTQRLMAFISPVMIAYVGFKYQFASALYVYWLATNVFTVLQQLYMFRKFGIRFNPAPAVAEPVAPPRKSGKALPAAKAADADAAAGGNGKRTYRAKKRSKR
jgi:YidC/Oxa1 family membrane protein insertase